MVRHNHSYTFVFCVRMTGMIFALVLITPATTTRRHWSHGVKMIRLIRDRNAFMSSTRLRFICSAAEQKAAKNKSSKVLLRACRWFHKITRVFGMLNNFVIKFATRFGCIYQIFFENFEILHFSVYDVIYLCIFYSNVLFVIYHDK